MRRLSATLLAATAGILPFELVATMPLGPLRISSVELFLYATLATWGVSCLGDPAARRELLDPRRWPGVLRAAAALGLVLLLSAARAPEFRGAAFKSALRGLSGILLGFAAADLLRAPRQRARVLTALVLGAAIAAVGVIVEAWAPSGAPWLRAFHDQTFQALGQVRGSGPFQFPNIAAMALEAAIPVALLLGSAGAIRNERGEDSLDLRRRLRWAMPSSLNAAAAAVMFLAVIATGSRAGLVGASAATLVVAVMWARDPLRRRAGWMAGGGLLVLLVAGVANDPALAARLHFWRDGRWYRSEIVPAGGAADRLPPRLAPGARATELLSVANRGTLAWRHAPPSSVRLSYHWVDARTGRIAIRDGLRTTLPADVPPGGAVTLRAAVGAPPEPGRYLLWWDMVHEEVTWFSAHGDQGRREPILVGDLPASPGAGLAPAANAAVPRLEDSAVPRRRLWRAALGMFRQRPLLGVGPDNFRHLYGRILGLAAPDDRLHANNLYFETLADLGLCGALALVALVVALAAAARRAWTVPLGRGIALGLGTFLLHGTLDYFFAFTPTLAMFWLLAGALAGCEQDAA